MIYAKTYENMPKFAQISAVKFDPFSPICPQSAYWFAVESVQSLSARLE